MQHGIWIPQERLDRKENGGRGGGGGVSHSLGLRVENDVENTCTFEQ